MVKNVIIIGAGGMSKVYFDILKDDVSVHILGFADDDVSKKGKKIYNKKIFVPISSIKDKFKNIERKYFIISIGDTIVRHKLFKEIKEYNFEPINAIHPDAHISSLSRIGKGNLIEAGVGINPGVTVGDNCIISLNASIGHDAIIGDSVHISPNVSIGGGAILEKSVDMGLNSCVLPNIKVGRNSVIGAGAVVTKDIPPNVIAYGIPARVVKKVDDENG